MATSDFRMAGLVYEGVLVFLAVASPICLVLAWRALRAGLARRALWLVSAPFIAVVVCALLLFGFHLGLSKG
jgi:hypothetical protein